MSESNKEMTKQEMLTEVNKAIYNVLLGGQKYKIGSRELERADLEQLLELRNSLEEQLAGDTGSPLMDNTVVAIFRGR